MTMEMRIHRTASTGMRRRNANSSMLVQSSRYMERTGPRGDAIIQEG